MDWSKYNYIFQSQGNYFIYNSLSTAIVQLNQATYEIIEAHMSAKTFPIEDEELMDLLQKIKVVADDEAELLKLKYISLSKRFAQNTLMLTINPTLDCNFACPYCFEGPHKHIYMNEEVENSIIDFITRHAMVNTIDVTWFGGEPLLAFRTIESLTKKMLSLGKHYKAGIITNGYLLNENIIKKFEELHIKSVQITLDGLAETHNRRRYLKNGNATFDKIVSNVKRLAEIAPDVKIAIRVNIDYNNENDFIQVYDMFNKLRKKQIVVSPAFVEDLSKSKPDECICNGAEQNAFLSRLFDKYGLEFSFFYTKSRRNECAVRNPNAVVIGPAGELYKCWNDVGKQDKVYGYLDGRVTNEKLLLKYLLSSDPFEDEQCKQCLLLPVCSGGCPYQRIRRDDENKNINVCPLLKEHLREYLSFHYKNKLKMS